MNHAIFFADPGKTSPFQQQHHLLPSYLAVASFQLVFDQAGQGLMYFVTQLL